MTLQRTASGALLRLANGALMRRCCCEKEIPPEPACPNPWEWLYTQVNGATWQQLALNIIQILFEDSVDCNGSNPNVQYGTAECCFVAASSNLRIVATGNVETQNAGFEQLQVSVDNVPVLLLGSVHEGGQCVMEELVGEFSMALTPGQSYTVFVWSSTMDGLWHQGANWKVEFFDE